MQVNRVGSSGVDRGIFQDQATNLAVDLWRVIESQPTEV